MTAMSQQMNTEISSNKRSHSSGHAFGLLSNPSFTSNSTSSHTNTGSQSLEKVSREVSREVSTSTSTSSMGAGGPMRRSHSKGALFNDQVYEVPILKSPARKTCLRSGIYESGVQAPFSPSHHTRQVNVLDKLLGLHFVFSVTPTQTVEYLKSRIQSRQGQEGLRIIPAHIQLITCRGEECHDDENLWMVAKLGSSTGGVEGAVLVVEPRVNELVSFFLASVSNLAGQGRSPQAVNTSPLLSPQVAMHACAYDPQLSPTTTCADALHCFDQPLSNLSLDSDSTLFFGEPMEDVGYEISKTASAACSPGNSPRTPHAPFSPPVSIRKSAPCGGLSRAVHSMCPEESKGRMQLYVDVKQEEDCGGASPTCYAEEFLSAKQTPFTGSFFAEYAELAGSLVQPAYSFDGISCIEQMMQRDNGSTSLPRYGAPLETAFRTAGSAAKTRDVLKKENKFTLLRQVDKGNYSSQSHIIFRDRTTGLLQLPAPKLKAMEQLVLQVQSGLRHGHAPEELSTSCRDSSRYSRDASLADSWERERREWWSQHLLSPQGQVNGNLTDFDYGELVQNCCGGTYMMRDSHGAKAAVFKPIDEEPYAPSNPKGFIGEMDVESEMKAGITVGGGAARECAAFLLDHDGRGSVPCTAMLRIAHTTLLADSEAEVQIKVGSLQRFQQHDCTAEDVGTSAFDVTQLHAIGVLDVRTFNMDRNSDNILVKMPSSSSTVQLVPIDHGYILPSYKHLEEVHACWLHWPQAKQPYSPEMRESIQKLDAEADMKLLRSTLALPEDSLLTLFIGTTLIKAAAANGLTLHETGMLMVREASDRLSAVEVVVDEAVMRAQAEDVEFMYHVEDVSRNVDGFYDVVKRHLEELLWQLVLSWSIAHELRDDKMREDGPMTR